MEFDKHDLLGVAYFLLLFPGLWLIRYLETSKKWWGLIPLAISAAVYFYLKITAKTVKAGLSSQDIPSLKEWFRVSYDEIQVTMDVSPPNKKPWKNVFKWAEVIRVGFKCEDLGVSDGIYIFTNGRPESYVVPIEADGGDAFWKEILRRKLFDNELAITAMSSESGTFIWPPEEKS